MNYTTLETLNLHVRVTRTMELYDQTGSIIHQESIYDNAQIDLDHSDMEDLLEMANAVAYKVNFHNTDPYETNTLSNNQLAEIRPVLASSLAQLFESLSDPISMGEFVEHIGNGTYRFEYQDISPQYRTDISLFFLPNMFSRRLFVPVRPGAVVNEFNIIKE